MGRIQFDQRVVYANGTPVTDVSVRVFDIDVGGDGDDPILATVTRGDGRIRGLSSEWIDANSVRDKQRVLAGTQFVSFTPPKLEPIYREVEIDVPVPDVPLLRYVLTKGSDRFEVVMPGPLPGADMTDPQIVVPWVTPALELITDLRRGLPEELAIGAVNGRRVHVPHEWVAWTIEETRAGRGKLSIDVLQPDLVGALLKLAGGPGEALKERLRDQLQIRVPVYQGAIGADDAAAITAIASVVTAFAGVVAATAPVIAATAGLVLATGVAIAVVVLALAVLYAVHEGYNIDDVTIETDATGKPTKMTIKMTKPMRG